jgi:hypothetical protein
MEVLRVNNFKGTNTEDENLSPNVLPFALNCDTSKGRLAKRLGYTSLVDLLSTGSPKGLHTAKFSGGDTLLVGADTSAYKLSGSGGTEVVTTTADFNEGTITDGELIVNDALVYNTSFIDPCDVDWTTKGWVASGDSSYFSVSDGSYRFYRDSYIDGTGYLTKTFTDNFENFECQIDCYVGSDTGDNRYWLIGRFYDEDDNEVIKAEMSEELWTGLGTRVYVNGSLKFSSNSSKRGVNFNYADDSFYVELISDSGINTTSTVSIENIKKVVFEFHTENVSNVRLYNFYLNTYTGNSEYISKTYDLTQTPVANALSWNTTNTPDVLNIYARGSNDGVRFGDWSVVSTSGGSIPNKRYVQVRVIGYMMGYTTTISSLDDFTISYTTAFDTATAFDTGLTGNKIRWVNYQGQQDDGTGTATELAQYVYYVDGTNYKKYDGTTVTAITGVPASNIIYEHKGYMFFVPSADESKLYFSDPYGANAADPLAAFEAVDETYYIQFPSKIKGLRTFQGKLVVSGDDFTSFVTGTIFGGTEDNTVVYQIDDKGVPNHESMAICSTQDGNILAMVTSDGLMYLSGAEYEEALEQKRLSDTVQTYINDGSFTNSYLKYHDSKLYFGFNSGVIPTDYIDSILVFDFNNGLTIDGIWSIALNDMAVFNGRLYGSSSSNTKLFELQSGENDDGADIDMKAVIRFNFGNVKTTLERVKIKATTDSDFDNLTSANLIVYNDSHSRNIDLTTGRWRESGTYYSQYKGQDLMESKRSIKKRGTFVEATFAVESSYKFEIDSLEFEYKGVRQ